MAEGIVPGGGLALLRCVPAVADEESPCSGDERTGVLILERALEMPTQIAENSAVDGGVVVARMLEGTGNIGFDALPATSTWIWSKRASLTRPRSCGSRWKNAVSVASVLLLTEATMTEVEEPRKERDASELAA